MAQDSRLKIGISIRHFEIAARVLSGKMLFAPYKRRAGN